MNQFGDAIRRGLQTAACDRATRSVEGEHATISAHRMLANLRSVTSFLRSKRLSVYALYLETQAHLAIEFERDASDWRGRYCFVRISGHPVEGAIISLPHMGEGFTEFHTCPDAATSTLIEALAADKIVGDIHATKLNLGYLKEI
jgi:hypothetical protein